MPIDPTSAARGVDGEAVIDAAVSAHATPQAFAHAKGVFLVDPDTGLPYAAGAAPSGPGGGLTNAQLRADPVVTTPAAAAIHAIGTPRVASQPVAISVQTAATGSQWAAFGNQACRSLQLRNNAVASSTPATAAAVHLRWRYAAQPLITFTLPAGAVETVLVAGNASEIEVQRVDQANTQTPLAALAFA